MVKLSSAAAAAIVALSGLAAPAQAALVTYDFWAASGTGTRQVFDCVANPTCAPVVTNFSVTGIRLTLVVDTAAGMPQYGDPNGGNGYTSVGGGTYYGLPVGISGSFSASGGIPFSSGPFTANEGSDVNADAASASFSGFGSTSPDVIDPQSLDRTTTFTADSFSISMADPGPLLFLGGEWLPGMSGLAIGSLTFMHSSGILRTAGGTGEVLEDRGVHYEFTAFDLRYGTGPASVPEPAPLALSGLGLLLLAARRRRRA